MTAYDDVINLARITAAEAPGGEWRKQAACRGSDPNLWHPITGENATAAKAICAQCPVTAQCLEYALTANLYDGVWGGLAERERRAIRRRRRRGAA